MTFLFSNRLPQIIAVCCSSSIATRLFVLFLILLCLFAATALFTLLAAVDTIFIEPQELVISVLAFL